LQLRILLVYQFKRRACQRFWIARKGWFKIRWRCVEHDLHGLKFQQQVHTKLYKCLLHEPHAQLGVPPPWQPAHQRHTLTKTASAAWLDLFSRTGSII
jgi:hypothetical protein